MHRLLFILPKDAKEVTRYLDFPETSTQLIADNYVFLTKIDDKLRLFIGGAYEEFTLEEAQEKLKSTYEGVDYIVYVQTHVKEFLSVFGALIDTFAEYKTPELAAIYSDYYSTKKALKKHEFVRNFTPENFVNSIPPVVVVNKKYLPGLPLQLDQQVALHLVNAGPVLHLPEATYILE